MNEENEIQLFPGHSFPSPGMFKPELFGWPCPKHRSLCPCGSLARCVSCHSVQHSCSASLDIMGTGTSLVTNVIWIVCSDPHGHMTKISHSPLNPILVLLYPPVFFLSRGHPCPRSDFYFSKFRATFVFWSRIHKSVQILHSKTIPTQWFSNIKGIGLKSL